MKIKAWLTIFVLICVSAVVAPSLGFAQEDAQSCVPLVQQGLSGLESSCAGLGVGNVCYGFGTVSANSDTSSAAITPFNQPGDHISLTSELSSVSTAALNPDLEQWGVATINIQADIPTSLAGQHVTIILVGDVAVENAVDAQNLFPDVEPIPATALVGTNLRSAPSTDASVVNSVVPGTELVADALSADSTWLRVTHEGAVAWVSRSLMATDGLADGLPILDQSSRTLMQEFYFRTGSEFASCEGALPSLLIIQAPDGLPVNLTANGTDIRLGSTMVLWTTANNNMHVLVLNGAARMGGLSIPAGFTARVPLNDDGTAPAGPWADLQSMTQGQRAILLPLEGLSADLMNYAINIPTEADIQETLAAIAVGNVGNTRVGPAAGQVSCDRFQPTSPLGGLAFGESTFFWDAALGADNYRLNVYDGGGALVGSFETGSDNTALTVDTSAGGIGGGFDFVWEVVALRNNQVACTTAPVNVLRAAGGQLAGTGGGSDPSNPGSGGNPWGN